MGALMIILGYPGELIVEGDLSQRWMYWMLAMLPFCYIVYELLVGLAAATASEADPRVRDLVFRAQWVTVVSWLTYPVVYIFPMLGFKGAQAVVNIQVDIASRTSSPSAELGSSSTASLPPSPPLRSRSSCCQAGGERIARMLCCPEMSGRSHSRQNFFARFFRRSRRRFRRSRSQAITGRPHSRQIFFASFQSISSAPMS